MADSFESEYGWAARILGRKGSDKAPIWRDLTIFAEKSAPELGEWRHIAVQRANRSVHGGNSLGMLDLVEDQNMAFAVFGHSGNLLQVEWLAVRTLRLALNSLFGWRLDWGGGLCGGIAAAVWECHAMEIELWLLREK